ncbi:MAG: hypothetical protein SFU56_01070 [Capsulimonadales bacterium]|nr:hypothetical protein [Capsulimonadales bacterium]
MMNDLLAGALVLISLTLACLFVGWRYAGRLDARWSGMFAAVVVLTMAICLILLQDSLYLVYLYPAPGAVVLGSTALPLIGLLGGTIAGRNRGKGKYSWRQWLVPSLLIVLGIAHALHPFLGSVPDIAPPRLMNGIFMQTSNSSCSAASAATLLAVYGIPATEKEMASLCFTRQDGTSMLGVYRGLRMKTRGTPYAVSVLAGGNVEDLRRLSREGPLLLSVGLDRFSWKKIDPRYTEAWGWAPGKRHAVVLFRFLPGEEVEIGDPSVGRERWKVESLSVLWHGDAIRLQPRLSTKKTRS